MRGKKKQLTPRETFGRNLKRARLLRGLSQEAVGLVAGLSRNYVGDIERGARNVAIDNMARLAAAVAVPLFELLDPDRFHDKIDET